MRSLGITITSVLLLQLSCKDKGTEPPVPPKNPREYTWTIDTLAYPGSFQTTMRDIWGSSPSDVYVVGHNERGFGKMFHYDGREWKPVGLNPVEGGTIAGAIDPSAIYGFAPNDIWVVGERLYDNPTPPPNFLDSSLIIHFDGRQWREHKISGGRLVQAIWGSSSSDLWVGGWTKYIHHYNGAGWQKDSLPLTVEGGSLFQVNAIEGKNTGEVCVLGNTFHNSQAKTIYYFFMRSSGIWSVIDSAFVQPGRVENKWGFGDLWASPSGTLYSCGVGIYGWNETSWEKLFDHPNFLTGITGTSDSNFFVVGHLGTAIHFNGRDWHQYNQFANPNAVLWKAWTDGKEVMVVGHTAAFPQKTIILHGR